MRSRWCPNGHFVTESAARFCPICGVPLPPLPSPPPEKPAFWVRALKAGATGLSLVLLGAYLVFVGGNIAREKASTPRPRPTASVAHMMSLARATTGPTRTPAPTRTPQPTATPRPTATPCPTPTPKALLDMTPAQFRARWDQLTEVQQKAFVASLTGQRIRWACEVFQVRDDGSITLDCESGAAIKNIMVRGSIPRAGAERYNLGQVVTFEADIAGVDTWLTFTLKVGPITIIE